MKTLIALVVAMFSLCAYSAETKIGYVDMQKALETTKDGQKASKELKASAEKRQKVIKSKEEDIKKLQEDFEKKAMVLSDDVKGKKQRELQESFQEYQKLAMKNQQELMGEEKKLLEPIFKKLKAAVEKVAKKDGYSMVVEKKENGVIWAATELDITEAVVKEVNK